MFRYKSDPWLWELDWSVQSVKTKKLKPPKKKRRKKKAGSEAEEDPDISHKAASHELSMGVASEDVGNSVSSEGADEEEMEDLDYVESTSLLSTIPPAEDIMYKRRQHLVGYPG